LAYRDGSLLAYRRKHASLLLELPSTLDHLTDTSAPTAIVIASADGGIFAA
jgi:hypothetical protein